MATKVEETTLKRAIEERTMEMRSVCLAGLHWETSESQRYLAEET